MHFQSILTAQRQAHIYATGLLAIITLGTLALIGLCFVALWFLVELAQLLLTAIAESCAIIGQTFTTADPLVKFLILVSLAYLTYRAGKHVLRRA